MYKPLITDEIVEIDVSKSPPKTGKVISKPYETIFANDTVTVVGRFEGDANSTWATPFTREELPTPDAKQLYDAVVGAVNSLHLAIRKTDKNFKTDKWIEYVEEVEE